MLKPCYVVTIATVATVLMLEMTIPGFSQDAQPHTGEIDIESLRIPEPLSAPASPLSIHTPTPEELVTLFKRGQPPLGSRSSYCAISPGLVGDRDVVWGDRPLFLWKGEADRLVLQDFYSGEVIWDKSLAEATPLQVGDGSTLAISYDGAELQTDHLYYWQLFNGDAGSTTLLFGTMTDDQRQAIADDLAQLTARLAIEDASDETVALAIAQFFGEQGLWSDAFAELYRLDEPSPEMDWAIAAMANHLCSTEAPRNAANAVSTPQMNQGGAA